MLNPPTALRPTGNFISLTPDPVERPEEANQVDPEDQALNAIGHSEGWKLITDYIDFLENELEQFLRTAMATEGVTFSEIGQRAMVKEAVVEYLEKVRGKVTDAMEIVDET